jgi:outer membrane murein-binding lipoprotein Lpp
MKWTMHSGCWNVHGLTKKIQEILSELQKLNTDVAILSKTNRNGKGDKHLEDFIHFSE